MTPRRSYYVRRVTRGGYTFWQFSVVGWGDSVVGYCRRRKEAIRAGRRCLTSLDVYFERYHGRTTP